MEFERVVKFSPAFDRRHHDPIQNYGIGGLRIAFTLKGPRGGVTWDVLTPMYLPHVREEWKNKTPEALLTLTKGMGGAITYHSLYPKYEGQRRYDQPCDITKTDYCYNDSGFIAGDDLFQKFLLEGDAAVWTELEEWYFDRVEPKK